MTEDADLDRLGERITLHNSNVININLTPAQDSLMKETLEAPEFAGRAGALVKRVDLPPGSNTPPIAGTVVCEAAMRVERGAHRTPHRNWSLTIFGAWWSTGWRISTL